MITKEEVEQIKMFLYELTELTKRHKVEVVGCGCCGSPWLSLLSDEQIEEVDTYIIQYDTRMRDIIPQQLELKRKE